MTPAESYERVEKLTERIKNAYKTGENASELRKEKEMAIREIIPEVGRRCTEVLYSDRKVCTITRVISPRKIAVRQNQYRVTDWENGKCEIFPDLQGVELIFTKRKNGWWVEECQPTSIHSVLLMLHYAEAYIDPHF